MKKYVWTHKYRKVEIDLFNDVLFRYNLYLYICVFIYTFIYFSIYLFIHLFVYLCIYLYIYLYIYLFILVFIYLFMYLFIHLFKNLFIYSCIYTFISIFNNAFIYLYLRHFKSSIVHEQKLETKTWNHREDQKRRIGRTWTHLTVDVDQPRGQEVLHDVVMAGLRRQVETREPFHVLRESHRHRQITRRLRREKLDERSPCAWRWLRLSAGTGPSPCGCSRTPPSAASAGLRRTCPGSLPPEEERCQTAVREAWNGP